MKLGNRHLANKQQNNMADNPLPPEINTPIVTPSMEPSGKRLIINIKSYNEPTDL